MAASHWSDFGGKKKASHWLRGQEMESLEGSRILDLPDQEKLLRGQEMESLEGSRTQ